MKVSRIPITLAALAFAAVSCMKADPFPGVDSPDTGDSDKLVGYVTDTDDNSIEHIKVTLDWQSRLKMWTEKRTAGFSNRSQRR